MTYNIRYDNPEDGENQWQERKGEVCALLNYYQPDVFGLQEALNHQRSYIHDCLNGYLSVGIGRDGEGRDSEATPIFYRAASLILLETETFWLSPTPDVPSKGWDAALNRIATYAKFQEKSSGAVFHVFNTHFDHIGSQAREHSAHLLLSKIKQMGLIDQKLIIMGDFNCEDSDPPYGTLSTALDDAFLNGVRSSYGPLGTWNDFETDTPITRRIDYIFTKNSEVQFCRHIDDRRKNNLQVSDHLPVLAEIRF